MLFVTHFL